MSKKYLAGDFPPGTDILAGLGIYCLKIPGAPSVHVDQAIVSIETVTEQNRNSILGKVGWGVIAGAALGPIGLLAGLIAGGRKTEICYSAQLADGRTFMAVTDAKTYQKLAAAAFTNRARQQAAAAR